MEYELSVSNKPNKKLMVSFINPATKRLNTIHFGAENYSDFLQSQDEERKRLYRIRHQNDKIDDLSFAGCWSWWLLWNKLTLKESIKSMEKKFGIKINLVY